RIATIRHCGLGDMSRWLSERRPRANECVVGDLFQICQGLSARREQACRGEFGIGVVPVQVAFKEVLDMRPVNGLNPAALRERVRHRLVRALGADLAGCNELIRADRSRLETKSCEEEVAIFIHLARMTSCG